MSACRGQLRACPACAAPMDAVPVSGDAHDTSVRAKVDICPRCRGIFLEFFDGEPSAISRAMVRRAEVPPGGAAQGGVLSCPDCARAMVRKVYLERGPELARCEECLAVFLSPDEVRALSALELAPEPARDASWLGKLLGWLPGSKR